MNSAAGTCCRIRDSMALITFTTSSNARSGRKRTFAATMMSSGPICSVLEWMSSRSSGAARIASSMALMLSGVADEQAPEFDGEDHRDDAEKDADREGPDRVESRLMQDRRERDAGEREEQADERTRVFEDQDDDLRRFRVADIRPPAAGA